MLTVEVTEMVGLRQDPVLILVLKVSDSVCSLHELTAVIVAPRQ
jgi:hypothetical protein